MTKVYNGGVGRTDDGRLFSPSLGAVESSRVVVTMGPADQQAAARMIHLDGGQPNEVLTTMAMGSADFPSSVELNSAVVKFEGGEELDVTKDLKVVGSEGVSGAGNLVAAAIHHILAADPEKQKEYRKLLDEGTLGAEEAWMAVSRR